jgi:hypothetical protein
LSLILTGADHEEVGKRRELVDIHDERLGGGGIRQNFRATKCERPALRQSPV